MELINLKQQNKELVDRVKKALPAIDRHTRFFDRKNSQTGFLAEMELLTNLTWIKWIKETKTKRQEKRMEEHDSRI
jgi:hypothetical protein